MVLTGHVVLGDVGKWAVQEIVRCESKRLRSSLAANSLMFAFELATVDSTRAVPC